MDQWLLAVTSGSAAKESDIELEITSSGPVNCDFSPPPIFPTIIMQFTTLSFVRYYMLISMMAVPYEMGIKMC